MLTSDKLIGLAIGLVLAVAYVMAAFRTRGSKPDLAGFIAILLSCAGGAAGLNIARMAFVLPAPEFGAFSNHRDILIVGGLAVAWVATHSVVSVFKRDCTVREASDLASSLQAQS